MAPLTPSTGGNPVIAAAMAEESINHQNLLDKLNINTYERNFRNSNWRPPQRRNKTIRQIMLEVGRREAEQAAAAAATSVTAGEGNNESINSTNILPTIKRTRPSYSSMEAAPSLKPQSQRRYCDITGLVAPYLDPKTRLRYHNREVFAFILSLSQDMPEKYLEARAAHTILK